MDVKERYNNVFIRSFKAKIDDLNEEFIADRIDKWDSVAHLKLITELEEEFDIMFDTEDILGLRSYEGGKIILNKYDIQF